MHRINRSSPIPVYYQIALSLKQRLASGEWNSGMQLRTEPELAKEYGVSRMTMRQALAELVKEGLVTRQRGSGTFVTNLHSQVAPTLSFPISFTLRFRELGLTPSSRVLRAELIRAPTPEIADYLQVNATEKIAFFKRLFLAEGIPMALNYSMLPDRLCPGITKQPLLDDSLSATLGQRYGLVTTRADDWLEALRASNEESRLLDTELHAPLLLLTTLAYLADGTPVEYSRTFWVGDRMRLHVNLSAYELNLFTTDRMRVDAK